jgi:tryptophan synthase alpha chain
MRHLIMAHMVAFYPDRVASLETARALSDGGARYLEVQFPFSDPTADGPLIQEACGRALEQGFKVKLGFELIRAIGEVCDIPIFIMGYANTVFFHGVESFLATAARSGARGVIIPDLPPDYDEGLFEASERAGIQAVPVIAPSISAQRLKAVLSRGAGFVYAALRTGITGAYTEIGDRNTAFLERVGEHGRKILAGFGISERRQVEALAPCVHACVVGSAFIKVIAETASTNGTNTTQDTGSSESGREERERLYKAVRAKIESLR